jgi:hypothetical protein
VRALQSEGRQAGLDEPEAEARLELVNVGQADIERSILRL